MASSSRLSPPRSRPRRWGPGRCRYTGSDCLLGQDVVRLLGGELYGLRSVFIHILGATALGGTDVQVGVHVLGFRDEVPRLQIIMILLPQRLGSMRGTVLAESHNLLEVRSHVPESYRPAVEKKKKNNRKRREEGRGEESKEKAGKG